jgi:hypothetical protein
VHAFSLEPGKRGSDQHTSARTGKRAQGESPPSPNSRPDVIRAQDLSAKPIKLIVGLAAGGATDVMARLVAQKMSESLRTISRPPYSAAPTR